VTPPGTWTLSRVGGGSNSEGEGEEEEQFFRLSVQNEIEVLEEKLREVDGWERRVGELEVLLSVQEA